MAIDDAVLDQVGELTCCAHLKVCGDEALLVSHARPQAILRSDSHAIGRCICFQHTETNAQLVLCYMAGIVQGLEAADPSLAVLRLAVEEADLP